ncbi:MAG: methyltransferase domain-containing protein [Lachnospiraceae bacterium]|nr:methyltransferase domain-containing protein [Lachnospiraceae bacterium]
MNIKWNAKDYTDNFAFVHQYGEDVVALVDAEPGSYVVDLGCGNGALTEKLKERGYRVLGVDASADMLETAGKLHPDIDFLKADATEFVLDEKADVIFSNAVFHWINADMQEKLIENVSAQLKIGGQLVCEFGGNGCAESVHESLSRGFAKRGLSYVKEFYFPTIGEYAPILEKFGFRVEYAVLFDRPTVQKTENGLEDWIRMFNKKPFEGMEPELMQEIIDETVEDLREKLYVNGKWIVDYVRIRFKVRKVR